MADHEVKMINMDIYDEGDYRKHGKSKKMPQNCLLVRRPLGRVKPSTYALPGEDFVYGRKDIGDEEGAREVVGSWRQHKANPESIPGRDFVRSNKYAVVNGCTTSKSMAGFRKANDIRKNKKKTRKPIAALQNRNNQHIVDKISTVQSRDASVGVSAVPTYGRPSKPSTPIINLITNSYQRNWIVNQHSTKANVQKTKKTRAWKYSAAQHTKASIGHTKQAAPAPKARFKLAQFKNVPSKVGSYIGRGGAAPAPAPTPIAAAGAAIVSTPVGVPPVPLEGVAK